MNETINSGDMTLSPWPDADGDMEVEFDNNVGPDSYAIGWLGRADVLTLVKELIKNFEITGDELNDAAK